MSLRTPLILTAGFLFMVWLYFTIHQFWHSIQMDTEHPVMVVYSNNMGTSQTSHKLHANDDAISMEILPTPHNSDDTDTDDTDDADQTILIEDEYLSERDEIELRFEFNNDHHLYLYDIPYFIDDSIFIMSMVTNSSELALTKQLQTLDEISCIFRDTYFLIFESNSLDDTPQILKNWAMNKNNDTINHNIFCKQYLYGFHRKRIHNFVETGDYLNDLFTTNTTKKQHIDQIALNRKTNILIKNVLFGDVHIMDELKQFKKDLSSRFIARIERYSFYRNMLINKMNNITNGINDMFAEYGGFDFDYLMILDLDIFGFQQRILLSELYYYHKKKRSNDHSNDNIVLCSHGTLAHGFYMDTFASVDVSNRWYYEYQRNKTFENVTNLYLKSFPKRRLEAMRSCFGGIVVYSNVTNIIKSGCNYNVVWSSYDVPKNVQQNVIDSQYEILTYFANKMRAWRRKKKSKVKRYKRRDNHICEHIPFHYCLFYTYNYSIAIAKYAYLFYEPVPMYKLDVNERLIEQTPSPTTETDAQRTRRQRRARIKQKKQQTPQQQLVIDNKDLVEIVGGNIDYKQDDEIQKKLETKITS